MTDSELVEIVTRVLDRHGVEANGEAHFERSLQFWEQLYGDVGAALRNACASEAQITKYLRAYAYRLCCDPLMTNDHIEQLIDAASVGLGVSLGRHLHVAAAREWIARGNL